MAKATRKRTRRARTAKVGDASFTIHMERRPSAMVRGFYRGLEFVDFEVISHGLQWPERDRKNYPLGWQFGVADSLVEAIRSTPSRNPQVRDRFEPFDEAVAVIASLLTIIHSTATHVGVATVRAEFAEAVAQYKNRVDQ